MFDLKTLPPELLARACGCSLEELEMAVLQGIGQLEVLTTLRNIQRFRTDYEAGRRRGACTAWGRLTSSWGGPAAAARAMGLKSTSAWDNGWRARIPFHRGKDVRELLEHSPLASKWELRNIDGRWLIMRRSSDAR